MKTDKDNPKYLAYALGELNDQEAAAVEAELANSEELEQLVDEYRQLGSVIEQELEKEESVGLSGDQRKAIEDAIDAPKKGRVVQWPYRRQVLMSTAATIAAMFMIVLSSTFIHKEAPRDATVNVWIGSQLPADKSSLPVSGPSLPEEQLGNITVSMPPAPVKAAKLYKSMNDSSLDRGRPSRSILNGKDKEYSRLALAPMVNGFMAGTAEDRLEWEEEGAEAIGTHESIVENAFESARNKPLSTFSIDVDTASYSMVRQMLNRNSLPSPDAVRIEEMINYFDYEYVQPQDGRPFSVNVDVASCPWAKEHRLVRIGLKGYEIAREKRPAANIVFLLDVSGSMSSENKLGYVKESMKKLLEQLNENDTVSIVVYAGASGLALPPTSCENKKDILAALEKLSAGGSTNGGAGIDLAYKTAIENFIKGGINRVILCTDGDFNVGVTGPGGLDRLIEEKAKSGVFLTILGYGMGNFRDNSMERLSNKGNGNYAYIDTLNEANKVLVEQVGSTLVTIAKDVKIQVNFNSQRVSAYRLLGYENRMLAARDFNDDKKDAGEIGAGHTVTALYEVVPKGVDDVDLPEVDPDKYATEKAPPVPMMEPSDELLTVKLRYKLPDEDTSTKMEVPVVDNGRGISSASDDFKFSAAVAGFGMLLRDSEHKGSSSFDMVRELAVEGKGADRHGYRNEFIQLVDKAAKIKNTAE